MTWRRCTPSTPCPVCGARGWCGVTSEGRVCCMAEAKGHPDRMDMVGYRRLRVDGNGGVHFWPAGQPVQKNKGDKSIKKVHPTTINWTRLHHKFIAALDPHLAWLCDHLEVDEAAVCAMQVGWSVGHFAFTFPMRDSSGKIVGFRLRKRDGQKYSIRGSREGLFIPSPVKGPDELIVISEGPSDTMHLHSQGYHTIGRPSCRGATQHAVDYCQEHPVVVVSDRDSPGRIGAADLAGHLVKVCPTVKIIEPLKGKDAREWIVSGATKDVIDLVIHNAYPEATDGWKVSS
jgi:phage/plasmid primase-like uncharacterized protein